MNGHSSNQASQVAAAVSTSREIVPSTTTIDPDAEPLRIISFVTHEQQTFALVKWSHIRRAYVPYEFIRQHFQNLIIKYMAKHNRDRKCPREYFERGAKNQDLPSDEETAQDDREMKNGDKN